jgi:hypothetical protein
MQFYTPGDSGISYFPKIKWQEGLQAPGASQMEHLKKLILSKSYFDRVPAQELVADNGEKYNYVAATMGKDYAMIYVYNGRNFKVDISKLKFSPSKATWFDTRTGEKKSIASGINKISDSYDPPGETKDGNDWVLILEK